MCNDDEDRTVEEKVEISRNIIKSIRGLEMEAIPLYSVVKIHVQRAQFLVKMWTEEDFELDPTEYGWIKGDGRNNFLIQLQDNSDPYYDLPKQLLTMCQCKGICKGRCKCKKNEKISGKCSMLTCKTCACFRTVAETEGDDPLVDEYQEYVDQDDSDKDADSMTSEDWTRVIEESLANDGLSDDELI